MFGDAMQQIAALDRSARYYKAWTYLIGVLDGQQWRRISARALGEATGMSRKSAQRALVELVGDGVICKERIGGGHPAYRFNIRTAWSAGVDAYRRAEEERFLNDPELATPDCSLSRLSGGSMESGERMDKADSDALVADGGGDIRRILEIMRRLRDPVGGCPWDVEQTFETIAKYTVEEAYEVADAIARGDLLDLKDELGDLLLQVVYHARIAEEKDAFDFADVVRAISDKMRRRHPHVFDGADSFDWESIKAEERAAKAARSGAQPKPPGVLDDVPLPLPALSRAAKLQNRAARVGFDWAEPEAVLDKLSEELGELVEARRGGGDADKIEDEFGDILFVLANLARHLDIDPEAALRRTNDKFTRRFAHIETSLRAEGRGPAEASLEEMESLWQAAKRAEHSGGA